jgi:predicted Fe-S protein YdhL (DUF1289 family)
MKTSGKDVYYIEVVGRALDVLEVFVHEQKPQLSLKEIADRLDQRMNSVFRLLYTLAKHGYVIKKDKQYELGSKLIDLTSAKMRHTDLVSLARPYMDALLARFRETVNLGVMMEGTIRYVEVGGARGRNRSPALHSSGQSAPGIPSVHAGTRTSQDLRNAACYGAYARNVERSEGRPGEDAGTGLRNRRSGKHAWRLLRRGADLRFERTSHCRYEYCGAECAAQSGSCRGCFRGTTGSRRWNRREAHRRASVVRESRNQGRRGKI